MEVEFYLHVSNRFWPTDHQERTMQGTAYLSLLYFSKPKQKVINIIRLALSKLSKNVYFPLIISSLH